MSIDRWKQKNVMEHLAVAISDQLTFESDTRHAKKMYADLAEVELNDGYGLSLDDPALMLLIRFLDATGSRTIENLHEVTHGLRDRFFFAHNQERLGVEKLELVAQLFELRSAGGWHELDRIFSHLIGTTLTAISDDLDPLFLFSPEDPGLGGDVCFTLGYNNPDVPHPKIAFGSTSAYVLGFVREVAKLAGDAYLKDGFVREEILLRRGRSQIFSLPVKPAKVAYTRPRQWGAEDDFLDPSQLHIQWADVEWKIADRAVMKELVRVAPESVGHLIKAAFLEGDLGM